MKVTSAKEQGLGNWKRPNKERFSSGVSNWDLERVGSFRSMRTEAKVLVDMIKEVGHQIWSARELFKG